MIDLDFFSNGTFSFRQAGDDSKTMTRHYERLASGTYTIEDCTIRFTLTAPIKQLPGLPLIPEGKDASRKELKGTMSTSGKELTLDYFGPGVVFTWRSPS